MLKLTMLRIERNLKQEKLATYIGKSRSTLSSYENGKIIPPYKTILELKKILNYFEDDLLNKVDYKKKIIRVRSTFKISEKSHK
ncbi:helix-turn-helix domain-containing protein [Clostridium sp. CF011]|uniref:helix-turn-helix transcriptional regulator n=1 Tax=Clostridium sp. CF011 TaxID=2843318 RepID=UPI001C0E3EBE|nr:helix-turn-helix transcriptional regulator [Clostridium sp. CF011]MBU3093540.1 helix-turn-helix domain-containing protein [Clostridium sp. CF011]WAG71724.1 helix-turn-helix domain-containing protein [Clostridium sp. CF011]